MLEFEEKIRKHVERTNKIIKSISTEEATKTSLIMPFFALLGFDVFNPEEFIPEYVADVGIKKGEKVDYAIMVNNELSIIIEAKSINEDLKKHDSQLFRYFGTTKAKIAVLTNGIFYKFFTDLDETNKMDQVPFLEVNLLDLKDTEIGELQKFKKENFDINQIIVNASNLRYASSVGKVLDEEFANPSDELVKLILCKGIYEGVKTQGVIDKYKPIIKKAIANYFNDLMKQKFNNVLNNNVSEENRIDEINSESNDNSTDGIVTTVEEMDSFYIVKSILSEYVNPTDIYFKDTISYFGVLYENKVTKWVCRVVLKENTKYVIIPDENKKDVRFDISSTQDIYKLKDQLTARLKSFID